MRGALPGSPHLVVGAGLKGLTAGLTLARQGVPVVVVDAAARPGGQARSFRYGDFTFDLGLHVFVSRDRAALALAREALGRDFAAFRPRAASRLANGSIVEDSARWCLREAERAAFYDLAPRPSDGWNCMQVSRPPRVVYPRRGGFGALCGGLARRLEKAGGRLVLGAPVGARDLAVEGRRVVAARVGRRWTPVRGVHWTVGSRLLARRAPRPSEYLVLNHFLVRGPAKVPYHWVRLYGAAGPFLPQLVYFPARLSSGNAPRGAHGVGAVVPLKVSARGRPADLKLARWILEKPSLLLPAVSAYLEKAGLLDGGRVLEARQEVVPVPSNHDGAVVKTRFDGLENFWDCDRFLEDDPRESGAPLQMRAALRSARAALAGVPS